jgi:PadR family transcriptional regulator PadR
MSTVEKLPDGIPMLQGTLEVLVLRCLKRGSNHAYGVAQSLAEGSGNEFVVDNGSLYPALQRLLQREWISAEWKTSPNARRAKYYQLTPLGKKQLAEETSKWERFAAAMGRILAEEA